MVLFGDLLALVGELDSQAAELAQLVVVGLRLEVDILPAVVQDMMLDSIISRAKPVRDVGLAVRVPDGAWVGGRGVPVKFLRVVEDMAANIVLEHCCGWVLASKDSSSGI